VLSGTFQRIEPATRDPNSPQSTCRVAHPTYQAALTFQGVMWFRLRPPPNLSRCREKSQTSRCREKSQTRRRRSQATQTPQTQQPNPMPASLWIPAAQTFQGQTFQGAESRIETATSTSPIAADNATSAAESHASQGHTPTFQGVESRIEIASSTSPFAADNADSAAARSPKPMPASFWIPTSNAALACSARSRASASAWR